MIYTSASSITFRLEDLEVQVPPGRILMADPSYFQVEYVINPHMQAHVGSVDRVRAEKQWSAVRDSYESLGFPVDILPATPGYPDLVFCANQTLPFFPKDNGRGVVLSTMYASQRRGEVNLFADYFKEHGGQVVPLPLGKGQSFEGTGDAIWHPGRRLLWGGHGFRTSFQAYESLSAVLDCPILVLELTDPDFYHLDTALSPLDEHTALVVEEAFDAEGRAMLEKVFDKLILVPEMEARRLFACNAHSPDGHHVLIQQGCTGTCAQLENAGFAPIELDTTEFIKAGGSVFCMKLAAW